MTPWLSTWRTTTDFTYPSRSPGGFLAAAIGLPRCRLRALCRGPLVGQAPQDMRCGDSLRQWPALLGTLALAVLVTVSAAGTMVYAKVLSHLVHQDERGAAVGG